MWMVDPKIMCVKHLLGEHVECHMFLGTLKKAKKIDGYVRNNCFELETLKKRHDDLVEEMKRRGMNHKTPIEESDCCFDSCYDKFLDKKINQVESLQDLLQRCPSCRANFTKPVLE